MKKQNFKILATSTLIVCALVFIISSIGAPGATKWVRGVSWGKVETTPNNSAYGNNRIANSLYVENLNTSAMIGEVQLYDESGNLVEEHSFNLKARESTIAYFNKTPNFKHGHYKIVPKIPTQLYKGLYKMKVVGAPQSAWKFSEPTANNIEVLAINTSGSSSGLKAVVLENKLNKPEIDFDVKVFDKEGNSVTFDKKSVEITDKKILINFVEQLGPNFVGQALIKDLYPAGSVQPSFSVDARIANASDLQALQNSLNPSTPSPVATPPTGGSSSESSNSGSNSGSGGVSNTNSSSNNPTLSTPEPEVCVADPRVSIEQAKDNKATIVVDYKDMKKGFVIPFYAKERIDRDCSNLKMEDIEDRVIESPVDALTSPNEGPWTHDFTTECVDSWIGACFIPCQGGECGISERGDIYLLKQEQAKCSTAYRLHYNVINHDSASGTVRVTPSGETCDPADKEEGYEECLEFFEEENVSIIPSTKPSAWKEDCKDTPLDRSCGTLKMDSDHHATVEFKPEVDDGSVRLYTNVENIDGARGRIRIQRPRRPGRRMGRCAPKYGYSRCDKYTKGSRVRLVASPTREFRLAGGWDRNPKEICKRKGRNRVCNVVLNQKENFATARFKKRTIPKYLLHYKVVNQGNSGGTVRVSPTGGTCSSSERISGYECFKYTGKRVVTFNPNIRPSAWKEDCSRYPTRRNCRIYMNTARKVTVEFEKKEEVRLSYKVIYENSEQGQTRVINVSGQSLGECTPDAGYDQCQKFEKGSRVRLVATGDSASLARRDFTRPATSGWQSGMCEPRRKRQICSLVLNGDTAETAKFVGQGEDLNAVFLYTKATNTRETAYYFPSNGRVDVDGKSCPSKNGFTCHAYDKGAVVTIVATGDDAARAVREFRNANGWAADACSHRGTRQICTLTLEEKETFATARFRGDLKTAAQATPNPTPRPGSNPVAGPTPNLCGNGATNAGEDCVNCPADVSLTCPAGKSCQGNGNPSCAPTSLPFCGNYRVDPGENCGNCFLDVRCHNGTTCQSGACRAPTPVANPIPTLRPGGGSGSGTPAGSCVSTFGPYTLSPGYCSCKYRNPNACDDPRFTTTRRFTTSVNTSCATLACPPSPY